MTKFTEMNKKKIGWCLTDRKLSVLAERLGISVPTLAKLRDKPESKFNTSTLGTILAYLCDAKYNIGGLDPERDLDL